MSEYIELNETRPLIKPQRDNRTKRIALGFLCILLLAALIATTVYLASRKDKQDVPHQQSDQQNFNRGTNNGLIDYMVSDYRQLIGNSLEERPGTENKKGVQGPYPDSTQKTYSKGLAKRVYNNVTKPYRRPLLEGLPRYNIEQDHLDIAFMIEKAKSGKFDKTLWSVLDRKPYLINVIPESEPYALLHYAALYNDMYAVKKLVRYLSCDVRVQSAPSESVNNIGGLIPQQLTSSSDIRSFLGAYSEREMWERFGNTPVFFATQRKGEKYDRYGLPLLLITLSSFKKTFSGNLNTDPSSHFRTLLETVFQSPSEDLEDVENEVINSLYGFDSNSAQTLRVNSKEKFFGKIINLYTSVYIHKHVNLVLKRQALFDYDTYRPRSIALHLGPYALMLDSVLTFWQQLRPFNGVTYRGVQADVRNDYHEDMTFVFLEFVSSTDTPSTAEMFAGPLGTIFVINNEIDSNWRPRSISAFSSFSQEREYLYPPGAEFTVTEINGNRIHLDLKDPAYV